MYLEEFVVCVCVCLLYMPKILILNKVNELLLLNDEFSISHAT